MIRTFSDLILNLASSRRRRLNGFNRVVQQVKAKASAFQALDDVQLGLTTSLLKQRVTAGDPHALVLIDAFAGVQEAIRRALKIHIRDTQLLGAVAMNEGFIVEMATGEGKSLMALFPAFYQSLSDIGVHVATLNPYLAARDHAQAEKVLTLLGSSVGLLNPGAKPATRRHAYNADITYSVYDEFARDYLRDNMQLTSADIVQRGHESVFLDEIDAILIDEARAPVTLSETYEPSDRLYRGIQKIVANLADDLSKIDPDTHSVYLTETGQDAIESALRAEGLLSENSSIYDHAHAELAQHVTRALEARYLYESNKDYVVRKGHLVLIDPVTGRAMPGRRYGDGLHQALEAKEGLELGPETQTLSTISIQNYFRIYKKRAGMTATAVENAQEFFEVYNLEVLELPPFKPNCRHDSPDKFFYTAAEKLDAVLSRIQTAHRRGQPVLVGTTSIRQADKISSGLTSLGIQHELLTARHDSDEAGVISRAGLPHAVTIAANMAGRGTDIVLGGPLPGAEADEHERSSFDQRRRAALDAGGLLVIATEKHDSRRLDKQLRGRSGRQGDIGYSVFMLSLDDDFLQSILKHKPDYFKARKLEGSFGQRWIQSFFAMHQKNVELAHSRTRKQLMKFDNILHTQRQIIFAERLRLMDDQNLASMIADMREQVIRDMIASHIPAHGYIEEEVLNNLVVSSKTILGLDDADLDRFDEFKSRQNLNQSDVFENLRRKGSDLFERQQREFGEELFLSLQRQAVLNAIDTRWNEHQRHMERLQSVIGLRAEGRRDPYAEYQTEAFELFEKLLEALRFDIIKNLARLRPMDSTQQINLMENFLFTSPAEPS